MVTSVYLQYLTEILYYTEKNQTTLLKLVQDSRSEMIFTTY